jgi:hypothetical protein
MLAGAAAGVEYASLDRPLLRDPDEHGLGATDVPRRCAPVAVVEVMGRSAFGATGRDAGATGRDAGGPLVGHSGVASTGLMGPQAR